MTILLGEEQISTASKLGILLKQKGNDDQGCFVFDLQSIFLLYEYYAFLFEGIILTYLHTYL